ncbi:MAG: hypothetical protein U0325_15015 [Polyangiales bacterium]
MTRRKLVVVLTAAVTLGACGDDGGEAAGDAIDSAETASAEAALVTAATGSVTASVPAMAATQAAAAAGTYLSPPGCVTATASGATVTYTVNNCTGPAGLALASGSFTATFAAATNAASVTLRGALQLRHGALNLNTAAGVSVSGATRTLAITTSSSGTGPNGRTATLRGGFTARYDGTCLQLDGAFTTTVSGVAWNATVTGYRRCANGCPSGSASFSTNAGRAVQVAYSGSTSATVTTVGATRTVTLVCGG